MFKTYIELKTIFRLLLSMGISLALVDHFIRASVTLIFGVISSVHLGFASRAYFVEKRNKKEVDVDVNITAEQVDKALKSGLNVIEEYSDDPRGVSCLLLCFFNDLPVHIVCAPHEDALIIITVYRPDISKWTNDYKKRR